MLKMLGRRCNTCTNYLQPKSYVKICNFNLNNRVKTHIYVYITMASVESGTGRERGWCCSINVNRQLGMWVFDDRLQRP